MCPWHAGQTPGKPWARASLSLIRSHTFPVNPWVPAVVTSNTASLLFLTLFLSYRTHIFEFFITLTCSALFSFFPFLSILLTEIGLATVCAGMELAVWARPAWNSRSYGPSLLSACLQVASFLSLPCSFRSLWHQVLNRIDSLLLLEWFRFLAFSFFVFLHIY